jgi:hypothetical protein
MNFFNPSPRRRAGFRRSGRRPASVGAALLVAFVVGCASPGPPHPPTLNLPQIVKDLAADRVGDQVNLHWTTPAKTTDNLNIKGPITAEICRLAPSAPSAPSLSPNPPASSHAPTCTPVERISVQPGPSQATETLPQPLTIDPVTLLTYRVQLFNRRGHSAGLSAEAFAAAGAAPPPVENLRATPIRTGAMLEWQPQNASASIELDRLLDGAIVPTKKNAQPKPATKPLAKTKTKTKPKPNPAPTPAPTAKPPFEGTPAAPAEVKLRASGQPSDAGGTMDRTAESGQTYHYTAQRVRSVTLAGSTPATPHKLELRSASSSPITVLLRDTFPPSAPTGLAAIPGGITPADRSIDLSWEPNTDSDLAGYIVYRQQISPTGALIEPSTRLNSTPVPGPAFRDKTAASGQRYAYRVTAIDAAGNESAPSADVQETLREQ